MAPQLAAGFFGIWPLFILPIFGSSAPEIPEEDLQTGVNISSPIGVPAAQTGITFSFHLGDPGLLPGVHFSFQSGDPSSQPGLAAPLPGVLAPGQGQAPQFVYLLSCAGGSTGQKSFASVGELCGALRSEVICADAAAFIAALHGCP